MFCAANRSPPTPLHRVFIFSLYKYFFIFMFIKSTSVFPIYSFETTKKYS